ncbi:MAG: BglG family transcription antiterminator LicT [Thomasclavelia ramosa]
MIIKKILNNNVVITTNYQMEEIIVMGKGLAYGKQAGDNIDMNKINKTFEVSLKPSQRKMINMLKDIPLEYMEISDCVIKEAKVDLEVDDSLYISLTDHIHTSIERYKEGVYLKNHMLFEIKNFYPKEFELGLLTLELIKEKYGINMEEDEAAFLALHIVSSEVGRNISDIYEITNFILEIIGIVKDYFKLELDEDSLSYYRFVTHLKFFGLRVFNKIKQVEDITLNNDLLEIMKEKYVESYLCTSKIQSHIEKTYHYELNDEEVLYLTIHVAKIISKK